MKNSLKLVALVLCLVMALCSFVACDNEKAENTTPAETKQEETKDIAEEPAKEVTDKKVIKMGTNAAFPPYESKEGDEFVGIDVEIAQAIAAELGCELEIVDMEFDSIIAAVNQGEVDFGMAGMTVTEERLQEVDFTVSYATGVQSVIVKEGSEIATIEDLKDKKIGVQLGTTGDIYASGDYGEENVIKYGKGADAVIALNGGDVDAVIIDNEPAKAFVAENAGLAILDTEYAVEDYAIAIKKGNTELLDNVNAALETLTANGTIDAIIAKFIKAE
ncbi:MAG: basic amino acid ABC transporter substrate-binding protein [Clostridia bacterium]|nr:basic amino acid ABC transporter substrate-binding protein [Clostridia bacterium]